METLTMNDGTVYAGTIIADGRGQYITIYLEGMSLADGFAILTNPAKTSRITATNREAEHVYEGYTVLGGINDEFGNCNGLLRKAAVGG